MAGQKPMKMTQTDHLNTDRLIHPPAERLFGLGKKQESEDLGQDNRNIVSAAVGVGLKDKAVCLFRKGIL